MLMPEGPVGKVVDVAVEAERLGFERVWIPDEGLAARECYVSLAAVAAATHRVQVGTGITNAYTRHPGVTASAIATLDELSGGRAALGVGAGGGLTLTPMAIDRVKPLSAMRELSSLEEASGKLSDRQMLGALLSDHESLARSARSLLHGAADAGDDATADLMNQRLNLHEKTAWMLRAHLDG